MAFCSNCGAQQGDNEKFCGECGYGTGQPAAPVQQPTYQPEPPAKKKSKKPLLIGGGAVIAATLVAVLVFTNGFGLLNRTGGDNPGLSGDGNPNHGNSIVADDDDEDASFFFDWEMIEAFGGMEGFEEWLIYGLGLYADDYYDIISGGSFMSPVERVDEKRGWLDGYPSAKD